MDSSKYNTQFGLKHDAEWSQYIPFPLDGPILKNDHLHRMETVSIMVSSNMQTT
jgi:hypothetical protein